MKHNEETESEAEKVGKSIKNTLRSELPLWATGAESHRGPSGSQYVRLLNVFLSRDKMLGTKLSSLFHS